MLLPIGGSPDDGQYPEEFSTSMQLQLVSSSDHVVQSNFPVKKGKGQNSLTTIFNIWNTMMGTSVLVMPWAIDQVSCPVDVVVSVTLCPHAFSLCPLVVWLDFFLVFIGIWYWVVVSSPPRPVLLSVSLVTGSLLIIIAYSVASH